MIKQENGCRTRSIKHSTAANDLALFTEVYGGYKISSMPYDNKNDAYEEIKNWTGDVTTYYHGGKWYIISK